MAYQILMPKQGNTVESCFLSHWHVKEGDKVEIGTLLFNYETDKAVFDFLSEVEGVVLKLLYKAGDIVDVLTPVCFIGDANEIIEVELKSKEDNSKDEPVVEKKIQKPVVIEDNKNIPMGERFASPRARSKAAKQNVDLNRISGSGPNGRILDRDVSLSKQRDILVDTQDTLYVVKPLSNIRKIIGKSMMRSLQNMAQLTHTLSFDVADISRFRKENNNPSLPKITLNDILIYSVSRVLRNHMDLNAHFIDGELRIFNHVHMGIATDTPRGLMVPVLKNADTLTLSEISRQAKDLISQSIAGSINPDLLSGGSFTISNLGTLDIEHFTPIINPPQTGILGVNTITSRVKMDDMGRFAFYQAMGLSLTYDHQVLDGAGASRFLKDLKIYLESFSNNINNEPFGLD